MAKAQPYDLVQLGFQASQFGDPADWLLDGGLLQTVIDQAAASIRTTMGATEYDGITDGDQLTLLREAESYLAGSRLWLRLETYERGLLHLSRGSSERETISSRLIRNANEYEDFCWSALSQLGVSRSLGFAVGHVATDSLSNEVKTA